MIHGSGARKPVRASTVDPVDPLDAALASVRVDGSMVGRSLVSPPWSVALDSDEPCLLAAVVHGEAWVHQGEAAPRRLGAGGVVVACGGRPLVIADRPETPVQVVVHDADTCIEVSTGASLLDHERIGARTWGSPDAPTAILFGTYRTEGALYELLVDGLPDLLVLGADPSVAPVLQAIAHETASDRPGQQVVVDRLMELLLFASVRAWATSPEALPPSWARALPDPIVGPALRAMHADPAARWTVEALAVLTSTSRAAFARRFRRLVGEPPLTHLTRWRIALAVDLLRDRTLDLTAVAHRVGYADAFSFSSAFRRVRGRSPSAHRRATDLGVPAVVGA